MEDESALAQEAGPEADASIKPDDEAQTEGQTTEDEEGLTAEAEKEAEEPQKSEAAKRREREKAAKERLRTQAEEAERRAGEAEARLQKIRDAGQQAKPPAEGDFQDYTDFQIAKALWQQDQRYSDRQSAEITEQIEAARREAEAVRQAEKSLQVQAWNAQVAEAKTRYTDFAEVAENPSLPITTQMADMILTADNGPDIAYHLGKNPALAARIAAMSPIEAAMALGEVKASLKPPQPRKTSQAPDPINPVKGGGGTAKDPSKMSHDEFRAWREAGGTF
jgi:hypothetical protein